MIRLGAKPQQIAALAEIWYEGWHGAHAEHVPSTLTQLRTRADFERRLKALQDDLIVHSASGSPTGFVALKGAELYQFYVSTRAQGSGIAPQLMAAAETELQTRAHSEIFLHVIEQNQRAIAFYTKCGWTNQGLQTVQLDTSEGNFALQVVVFSKENEAKAE